MGLTWGEAQHVTLPKTGPDGGRSSMPYMSHRGQRERTKLREHFSHFIFLDVYIHFTLSVENKTKLSFSFQLPHTTCEQLIQTQAVYKLPHDGSMCWRPLFCT